MDDWGWAEMLDNKAIVKDHEYSENGTVTRV